MENIFILKGIPMLISVLTETFNNDPYSEFKAQLLSELILDWDPTQNIPANTETNSNQIGVADSQQHTQQPLVEFSNREYGGNFLEESPSLSPIPETIMNTSNDGKGKHKNWVMQVGYGFALLVERQQYFNLKKEPQRRNRHLSYSEIHFLLKHLRNKNSLSIIRQLVKFYYGDFEDAIESLQRNMSIHNQQQFRAQMRKFEPLKIGAALLKIQQKFWLFLDTEEEWNFWVNNIYRGKEGSKAKYRGRRAVYKEKINSAVTALL